MFPPNRHAGGMELHYHMTTANVGELLTTVFGPGSPTETPLPQAWLVAKVPGTRQATMKFYY